MLRNDLIVQLSQHGDNDTVVVDINGIFIDVEMVTTDRGCVVLIPNQEDVRSVLADPEKNHHDQETAATT